MLSELKLTLCLLKTGTMLNTLVATSLLSRQVVITCRVRPASSMMTKPSQIAVGKLVGKTKIFQVSEI